MVPDNQVWNYNFMGISQVLNMKYGLILQIPKDFYNEIHRSSHFIKFNKQDEEKDIIDMDDAYK